MPRLLLALATLLLAGALAASAGTVASPPPTPAAGSATLDQTPSTADYAVLDVGSSAPDFWWDSPAGSRRLHDLRAQGDVLMLLAPPGERLVALERERSTLVAMGIVPVAVLDRRAGACRDVAARLRLGFAVIPDPQHVIGAQFNALAPASRSLEPAWFVLARDGRVRALGHGAWPARPWIEVAAGALGHDAVAPASARGR